jgi:hypothetical protein
MNEYIYILSNPSMPGLIKVGKTTTHPSQRMSELHSTGVPTPFELEFSVTVSSCDYSEKAAHLALASHRVTGNREFFRVSVKKAIELILPKIGDYTIHDVKEAHGIEQIRIELDRREREKRDADQGKQMARQQEADRREAERLAKRRAIEQKILFEEQRLKQLGQRPVKKELPGIGNLLIFCYWPIPLGWIVWGGALRIFETKYQTTGLVCILLIVAGYIFSAIEKKNQAAFDIVHAPFQEIDNLLFGLRQDLEKLP